jgi:hypothetical protein
VDSDQVTRAVVGCWRDGEVTGLEVDDLSFEEARSLTRPAMTYVRGQLRSRLTAGSLVRTGAGCTLQAAAAPVTGSSNSLERMPAVAGCGRLSAGVRNPEQPPERQRRNRPGVCQRFRRRPTQRRVATPGGH